MLYVYTAAKYSAIITGIFLDTGKRGKQR